MIDDERDHAGAAAARFAHLAPDRADRLDDGAGRSTARTSPASPRWCSSSRRPPATRWKACRPSEIDDDLGPVRQLQGAGRQPRARGRVAARDAGADPRRPAQHEHAGRLRQLGRRGGAASAAKACRTPSSSSRSRRAAASRSSARRSWARCRTSSSSRSSSRARPSRCRAPTARPMARIGRDVVASSLPAALMFELSRSL